MWALVAALPCDPYWEGLPGGKWCNCILHLAVLLVVPLAAVLAPCYLCVMRCVFALQTIILGETAFPILSPSCALSCNATIMRSPPEVQQFRCDLCQNTHSLLIKRCRPSSMVRQRAFSVCRHPPPHPPRRLPTPTPHPHPVPHTPPYCYITFAELPMCAATALTAAIHAQSFYNITFLSHAAPCCASCRPSSLVRQLASSVFPHWWWPVALTSAHSSARGCARQACQQPWVREKLVFCGMGVGSDWVRVWTGGC